MRRNNHAFTLGAVLVLISVGVAVAQTPDTSSSSSTSASVSSLASSETTSASVSSSSSSSSSVSSAATAPLPVINGKGVLVIEQALLDTTLKQHPDSVTGGLTTLTVKIGEKIRDKGLEVLKPVFTDGVETATAPKPGAYNLAITLDGFTYKYDQMRNAGMAITPLVNLSVTANVTDGDGKVLLHRSYAKAEATSGTFFMSFKPQSKVLSSLDVAISDLLGYVVQDLDAALKGTPTVPVVPALAPGALTVVVPAPEVSSSLSSSSATSSSAN